MQAIGCSTDEMAKVIGYVVMELERAGCAITAEAINKRLSIVLDNDSKVASESVTPSKQLQFNESLCG